MRNARTGALIVIAVAMVYFIAWPTGLDPVAYEVGEDPGLTGAYAENHDLDAARLIDLGGGGGPEDIALGPDGLLYSGLDDGRIVRFQPDGTGPVETFADTGGRPLGLEFDAAGRLIVADAFKGLLSIAPDGGVTVLADQVDGVAMKFADDLDIAADGTIWFSDASMRRGYGETIAELIEGRATGRLLSYDPASGTLEVHMDGLAFANGVALGPGDAYVVINETFRYRIHRYWITGPKAGGSEIFIDNLPGFPDNVSFNGRDTFWVALVTPRQSQVDAMTERPRLRQIYMRAAALGLVPDAATERYGWVLGVDERGQVTQNLQAPTGHVWELTSVNEFDFGLALGSLSMPAVAILDDWPRR